MELNKFIEKLMEIKESEGGNIQVTMADLIPVTEPVLSENRSNKKIVVITDQN